MKCFLGLLVLYLLNTADSQSCCWFRYGSLDAPSDHPESESPAGGPSANSNAAVCYFYRSSFWSSSGCLVCKVSDGSSTRTKKCCTKSTTETDDTAPNGPTPDNEYLIGRRQTHNVHEIDWHNLYPKKGDNSGYHPYDEVTQTGRRFMGLHPGTVSLGCVTVDNSAGNSCWDEMESIVSAGSLRYNNWYYDGFLYVV